MAYTINDFKTRIISGVRPNLFSVNFPFGGILQNALGIYTTGTSIDESIKLLCKSAALPASTQGVAEVPFRGRVLKLPGDRTYDSWTATFYNDSNFAARSVFEAWINLINKSDSNTGQINPNDIFLNIEVNQLAKTPIAVTPGAAGAAIGAAAGGTLVDTDILRRYTLFGTFPTSVSQISLGYDQNDQIEEFDVEFQYQYFTIKTPANSAKDIL